MPPTRHDIVEDHSLTKLNAAGDRWRGRSTFWITELEVRSRLALAEAIDAVGINVGDTFDDTDPRFAACFASEPTAVFDGEQPERSIVTIDWGPPEDMVQAQSNDPSPDYSLSVSSITEQVQVQEDAEGNPIQLQRSGGALKTFTATRDLVLPVIELTRVEDTTLAGVLAMNVLFASRVNESDFNLMGVNIGERKAYCLPVLGEEISRTRYRITRRIALNPQTFDRFIAIVNPDGTIPADALNIVGNASGFFRIQEEADLGDMFNSQATGFIALA